MVRADELAKPRSHCFGVLKLPHHQSMTTPDSQQSLKDEIADLERRLQDAKSRLKGTDSPATSLQSSSDAGTLSTRDSSPTLTERQRSMHCYF